MNGGHEWTRTIDHHHVKVVLYQLSYATTYFVGGNYIQTKLKQSRFSSLSYNHEF